MSKFAFRNSNSMYSWDSMMGGPHKLDDDNHSLDVSREVTEGKSKLHKTHKGGVLEYRHHGGHASLEVEAKNHADAAIKMSPHIKRLSDEGFW